MASTAGLNHGVVPPSIIGVGHVCIGRGLLKSVPNFAEYGRLDSARYHTTSWQNGISVFLILVLLFYWKGADETAAMGEPIRVQDQRTLQWVFQCFDIIERS